VVILLVQLPPLEIKRKLKDKVDVTLIDRNENFVYIPSLIWVPIRRREVSEIIIPRKQVLEKRSEICTRHCYKSRTRRKQSILRKRNL
jgi:NADH dehydrogenase FAD-containing subunit